MSTQFNGSLPVRFSDAAFAIGSRIALRVVASTMRKASVRCRPTASFSGQPIMLLAMGLKKVMFPDMSVQITASAMQFERGLGAFLFIDQDLFVHLALNGIAQGSHECVRLDLALDEIVLRALSNGLNCLRLVVQAGQQHNGDAGRDCAHPSDRLQSFWIGQSQVQQDNVNGMPCKIRLGVCQTFDVGQREGV